MGGRLSSYDELVIPVVFASAPPLSSSASYHTPTSTGRAIGPKLGSGSNRNTSRTLRSRLKTLYIQAARQSTIKDLKVSILSQTGITPLLQKIYYKPRTQSQEQGQYSGEEKEDETELDNDLRISEFGYLKGEELILVEVKEEGDLDDDDVVNGGSGGKGRNGRNEGFGGTGLLARIACPDCTYENDGTAECCEMCMRVSVFSQGLSCVGADEFEGIFLAI